MVGRAADQQAGPGAGVVGGVAGVHAACGGNQRRRGALAFVLTALFALAYRRFVVSRLGGQTGDTLGAGNELFEVWFLLMLC